MKKWLLTIFILSFSATLYAAPILNALNYVLSAPPKDETPLSMYTYLNTIYNRWNTLQVSTQEPNGNISANYGNMIIYYDSTDYWLAIQTTSPSGSTWKGVKLGAV